MAKNDINKLSKREILQSLYHEQVQGNATLSRLFTAMARTLDIKPEDLAKSFGEDQANQEYIGKFNGLIREQQGKSDDGGATETPATEPNI